MKGVYAVLSTSASLLLVHSKPLPSTTFSSLQITSNLEAIPSCSTYHGKTPTKDPLHFIYYPAGCPFIDLEATIVSPFNWEDGKVMLSFDSSLDESVLELSERKAELVASKMILEMDRPKSGSSESQQRFGIVNNNGPNLISSTKFGELYQFTNDQQLIDFTSNDLYSFTELVAIHSSPLPFPNFHRSTSDVINNNSDNLLNSLSNPVDESSRLKIVDHLKKLKFSNLITTILASLPREQLVKDVEYLTGENQPGATSEDSWHSRHSMSSGGFKASNWMLKELSSFGLNCTQTHYLPGFSPYVTCIILGREAGAGTFVLGAHMDSRGTFGSGVAPGGDDDGSGAAALMSIARHITTYPLTFKRKIIIAAFTGEEQGLLGSHHLARTLKEANEDVVLMVQQDMLGYRKPGEPLQIAFPDLIGLDEARYLMGNISSIYSPELVVGVTNACCSDHQAFEQYGYASTWVFERNNPIADPFYHNSGDISRREGYDYEQIYLIARVVLATLLEVGQFAFE